MEAKNSQRYFVYRWQACYLIKKDTQHLSLNVCNFIAQNIFSAFDLNNPPLIKHSLGRKHSRCCFKINTIKLIEPDRNRIVLTHEIAHALAYRLFGSKNHESEFMGIYIFLLNKWCNIPLNDLYRTADYEGVKYEIYNFKLKIMPLKSLCTPGRKNSNHLNKIKFPSNKQHVIQCLYPKGYKLLYCNIEDLPYKNQLPAQNTVKGLNY